MAPTINFAGLASGIDSNALIDAINAAAKKSRVEPKQTRVTELQDTNDAFSTLKEKMNALKDLLDDFRTINGGGLQKLGTSADETIARASATGLASNGTYSVQVTQLAKNGNASFDDRFTSDSSAVNSNINDGASASNRTVTVQIGTGSDMETVSVVLTSTTTWSSFVQQFNAQATAATASIVNVGTPSTPSYAVMINGANTGTQKGQIAISVGSEITGTVPPKMSSRTISQATDATFKVSGISTSTTITRSTNEVTDVIPGVTLEMIAVGTTTVTIGDDADATQTKVQEWVDAFNEIVTFVNEQNKIQREESGSTVTNVFSPFARTSTDDNALSALKNSLSNSVYGDGSIVRIMSDLGIQTQRDGTLKFNTDDFQEAVSNESTSVNEVLMEFADSLANTNGVIDQYVGFNQLIDLAVRGNSDQITNLNRQIAEAEANIAQNADALRARFARLESLTARLQQQQSSLLSALSTG